MPRGVNRYDEAARQRRLWRPERGALSWWYAPGEDPYQTDFDASNMVSNSTDISAWSTTGVATITANTTVAPDGTTTADTLTAPGASTECTKRNGFTVVNGQPYVSSCFAKYNGSPYLRLRNPVGFSSDFIAWFDLQQRRVASVNIANGPTKAGIADVGGGFVRCWINGVAASTLGYFDVTVTTSTSTGAVVGGESLIFWGVQFELAESGGLYRPTTGSTVAGSEPTWRSERVRGALAWTNDGLGGRGIGKNALLPVSSPYRNYPPLIGM